MGGSKNCRSTMQTGIRRGGLADSLLYSHGSRVSTTVSTVFYRPAHPSLWSCGGPCRLSSRWVINLSLLYMKSAAGPPQPHLAGGPGNDTNRHSPADTAFAAQISARYVRGLEQVVEALDAARQALPQFELYAETLCKGERCTPLETTLRSGLVRIYVEFIGICHDAIVFFKRRTICACSRLPGIGGWPYTHANKSLRVNY